MRPVPVLVVDSLIVMIRIRVFSMLAISFRDVFIRFS